MNLHKNAGHAGLTLKMDNVWFAIVDGNANEMMGDWDCWNEKAVVSDKMNEALCYKNDMPRKKM